MKGFTLIELLAVLVILAIIALIATPIILNIISDTKEESSLRSADFYLDALELSIAKSTLDNKKISDGIYNILDDGNLCISYEDGNSKCADKLEFEVKGEIISKGTVTIKNGKIDEVSLIQNNKIIEKNDKGKLSYKQIKAPKSFAEDDWDTIISNVKIGNTSVYKKNLEDNTNNTNKIKLTIDGTEKEYTVRIANISVNGCDVDGFSQSACGFVIEFVDKITNYAMNSETTNIGGWRDSEMRKYVNNDIFNSFPENLRKNILTTYVVSGHGSTEGEENFKTYDKLYLMSPKELFGTGTGTVLDNDTAKDQTRQLDYYSSLGVTKETYEGTNKGNAWWLRTAPSNKTGSFFIVLSDGKFDFDAAKYSYRVYLAFRI